ncbi:MAG: hypothetical protein IKC23_07890 [Fibrobacter sp.]|nr:hypothetical protein [Fibrobacter sp.]
MNICVAFGGALSGQAVLLGRNCENAAKMAEWLCWARLYCCELAATVRAGRIAKKLRFRSE